MLVLGSRNAKKCEEIVTLLAPHGIEVRSLAEFPDAPEVVEDGSSFAENAAKKARETALAIGHPVLAEDSGLCVDALDGQPGIFSARFAGEPCDDTANNRKLVSLLEPIADRKRTAHYVCHVAFCDAKGEILVTAEDRCRGKIVLEPRGEHGFGYDPHFLIPEYHRTFGELGPTVKTVLSHRSRAFRSAIPQLTTALRSVDRQPG